MNYWFFFSYAHADQDDYLLTFYKDLAKEVKGLMGPTALESGFIDRQGIEHGAQWDKALEQALQSCSVFVPIYSPSYFLSEYCGKEFKVFSERLDVHLNAQAANANYPLTLPVLWFPEGNVLQKLPSAINKIQYKHGDYPDEYLAEGLLQLVRLGANPNSKYYNQYWDFVRKFASTLVKAAAKYPLPALPVLTPLDKVESFFPPATRVAVANTGLGPRYVQFIFVVGKQSELEAAQRSELKFYGQKGGADWLPYLDAHKESAAAIAIEAVATTAKDLQYEEVALSSGIIDQIEKAASQNKIVVLIVDSWTLRLDSYNKLLAPLDKHFSVNCITLILWNDEDQEALTFKSTLETVVNGTFSTKITFKDRNFFHTSINSYTEFKTKLILALAEAQAKIVETAEVQKKLVYALVKMPQTQPSIAGVVDLGKKLDQATVNVPQNSIFETKPSL